MDEYKPIPIPKYIDYAFQRLLFSLTAAYHFQEYSSSKEEYKTIIDIVSGWINNYVNGEKTLSIDKKEFDKVYNKLYELDNKYLSSPGLYAEDCYEWIIQLSILLEKLERNEK